MFRYSEKDVRQLQSAGSVIDSVKHRKNVSIEMVEVI